MQLQDRERCPLNGNCQIVNVIYKAAMEKDRGNDDHNDKIKGSTLLQQI